MNTGNLQYMLEIIGGKTDPTGTDAVRFLTEALKEFAGPAGVDRLTCSPQDVNGLCALLNGLLRLAAANDSAFSSGPQRQRLDGFLQKSGEAQQKLGEIQDLAAQADEEGRRLDSILEQLEPERAGLLRRREENERKRARIAELEDGRLDRAAQEAGEIDRRCQELEQQAAALEQTLAAARTRLEQTQKENQRLAAQEESLRKEEAAAQQDLAAQQRRLEQAGRQAGEAKRQLEEFETARTQLERQAEEEAARAAAFRSAWENLWRRQEEDRSRLMERLRTRLPESSPYHGDADLPAAVRSDLEQIAGWLDLLREQIQLGVSSSESMLEHGSDASPKP